ncbi:biotin/lipoyl-binding protein [Sulfobacillus sp. DSM 109850]|uniref:Biotin/lipoyl-binding protein n=1 Tax=Sulfobacillus harzensis TaxID=2729629 RepID=A0A7Y0LA01_9FIRM|nr:biotin/lipoyl-binding protein [Sulfobacillus harzensis]
MSTDLVGGFGGLEGRALRPGDVVTYAGGKAEWLSAPTETLITDRQVRILPGARRDQLPAEMWMRLLSQRFQVSTRSNRVGIRLEGPPLADASLKGDAISEGMAVGSIQAPPSGELLVLTKGRGSIGGYPTLAHVIMADWPILAQLRPGQAVSFTEVDQDQARHALLERRRAAAAPLRPVSERITSLRTSDPTVPVSAPMWSTVYVSQQPGASPLAPIGAFVNAGQTLAVLEVMKQFYDLESPVSGRVKAVHFADGATVEEGTLLFEIDASQ